MENFRYHLAHCRYRRQHWRAKRASEQASMRACEQASARASERASANKHSMKGGEIMNGYRNNLPKFQSLGEMFSPYQVHPCDTVDRLTNRNDPDYSPPVVAADSELKPEKTPLSDFE